jgi:hypothetical protein
VTGALARATATVAAEADAAWLLDAVPTVAQPPTAMPTASAKAKAGRDGVS